MTLVAWCGDSITAGTGAAWRRDFPTQALKILGARISESSTNAGVGGERSEYLLARMSSILADNPGMLVVLTGTNDAGQAVTVEDYASNIAAIKSTADSAGVPVVFGLVPPRASASAEMDLTHRYNLWLRTWCNRHRIPCADTYGALAEPATGLLAPANDSGDGVHPSSPGHAAIAAAVAATMKPLLTLPTWLVVAAGLPGLTTDPLATGTSGWAFAANPYTAPVNVAAAPGEMPAGQWIRFTANNTGGGSTVFAVWGAPLGAEGVDWDEGDELLVAMYVRGSSAAAINKIQLLSGSAPVGAIIEAYFPTATPGPLLRRVTIPAVSGTLRLGVAIQADAGQTSTVDVGACDVFNLTKLGLTDLPV